jgi:hypothetical protein
MSDVVATLVTMFASGLSAGAGAWFALHNRMASVEHELWGVKGSNGLKGAVTKLEAKIDAVLLEERTSVARLDRRNKRQHPEQDA